MSLLARWIINSIALLVTAYFFSGIHISGFASALMAALVLGIVNAIIRPIFILFTLPLNLLTLGLFTLVINGIMLKLAAALVSGFYVQGIFSAIIGAIFLSLISSIMSSIVKEK